jgi:gamma-glutamyltranspeptidase/glutathione hydrolase
LKNIVAGGDSATVDAVREVIEVGGNAVDGAVAGVFTSMVAESTLTSAGGGGVMMVCPADGEPVVFDFFTDMPTGCASEDEFDFFRVTVDFGPATQDFYIGRGAAGVPSNVAGLLHAQERLGRLKPKAVLAPAIRAASKGIPISSQQSMFVQMLAPILTHEPSGQALYAPDGKLLKEGDRIVMPEFAAFLEELAVEGSRMFYHGETARLIADWAESGGFTMIKHSAPLNSQFLQERSKLGHDDPVSLLQ